MAKTKEPQEREPANIPPFLSEDQVGKKKVSTDGLDEKLIREKTRAGLRRDQAIEVLKAQKEADKANKK